MILPKDLPNPQTLENLDHINSNPQGFLRVETYLVEPYAFRKRVTSRYPDLFGEGENEYSAESQFGRKWGWYSSFHQLAQGDVTRFERVGRLGVHEALTFLVFEKERIDVERKQLDKIKK